MQACAWMGLGRRTLVTATVLDLDGNRVAPPLFLDSGGFDGRQAHTRRHIDRLKSKVAKLESQRTVSCRRSETGAIGEEAGRAPPGDRLLLAQIQARNKDLAHLAANILLLLATVWEAELIAGESLKSLKTTGHGRSARGRWVRWRNNSQIRGALWRCLRYKCHLTGSAGLAAAQRHLAHLPPLWQICQYVCLACTYSHVVDAGAWLRCVACGWNGARDYAAAINIALLRRCLSQAIAAHWTHLTP